MRFSIGPGWWVGKLRSGQQSTPRREAASGDFITVNGLKNYLSVKVPELMKKYSGSQQFPASYGFGNDFPVEVIRK